MRMALNSVIPAQAEIQSIAVYSAIDRASALPRHDVLDV